MKRYTTIFILTVIMVCGCGEEMRNRNLKKVAKDWCMVIRASQVVPVYPLTEDLQVGDVFLVQHTVDDQHEQYEEDGFLPMDNLIARLEPSDFSNFYDSSFAPNESTLTLPADWLSVGQDVNWGIVPGASFPTYSFSVRSGAGFSLAVPVQSVPVGLSLMGADVGEGTIGIAEAKTYGIDTISLYKDVLEWEQQNHEFLLKYASTKRKTNYVRVVSRVYLAGKMNVSIRAARSWAGGLQVGDPKPLELLAVESAKDDQIEAKSLENYTKSVGTLNKSIDEALKTVKKNGVERVLPGGTVKIAAASSRAISMEETFARPLAIGYLGFDMAIGPDGVLGPPIPTHAVLTQRNRPSIPVSDTVRLMSYARLKRAYTIIEKQADAGDGFAIGLRNALDQLGSLVPKTYPVPIFDSNLQVQFEERTPLRSDPPRLQNLTTYCSRLNLSLEALEQASELSAEKRQWLQPTRKAYGDISGALRRHRSLLSQANEYASYLESE